MSLPRLKKALDEMIKVLEMRITNRGKFYEQNDIYS